MRTAKPKIHRPVAYGLDATQTPLNCGKNPGRAGICKNPQKISIWGFQSGLPAAHDRSNYNILCRSCQEKLFDKILHLPHSIFFSICQEKLFDKFFVKFLSGFVKFLSEFVKKITGQAKMKTRIFSGFLSIIVRCLFGSKFFSFRQISLLFDYQLIF